MKRKKIRVAIVGVGNCASSLVQGIEYYKNKNSGDAIGLMHWNIGGYEPGDIEFVAAFDVDERKVGKDLSEAIFSSPNCTKIFCAPISRIGVRVAMGRILDGIAKHMEKYPRNCAFVKSEKKENSQEQVVRIFRDSGVDVILNYLPVGSEKASRFYATCALKAGVALVNCIPVFIASDRKWADKFARRRLPLIGDDIKSQMGATVIHRNLAKLFQDRGVKIDATYQLNVGGNTDFLNMLDRNRLDSKRISKTKAVQSQLRNPLASCNIHVGPSDYVQWLNDNKICFMRIEGRGFAGIPVELELRISVEDSPNSAGIVIDAIRCAKVALDRRVGGALVSPSAYFMKHPPHQFSDEEARRMLEDFISGKREN